MQNTQDERARKIALFFLFSLADERVALQAAHKAVAQFKATSKQQELGGDSIKALKKIYERHKALLARESIGSGEPPTSWVLPPGVSAAAWLKFQKNSSDQEIIALVLSKIVGFSDDEIARGLGVSVGTVRYRIGKALRHLGSIVEKGA